MAGGLLANAFGDANAFAIAGTAVTVALFLAWLKVPDLRAKVATRPPLLETLKAMRDRRLFSVGALNFALNFAAGGMVLTTIGLLVQGRGLSLLGRNEQGTAGILMGVMTVVDAALTPLAGRLGDRFNAHARVAAASLAIMVPGLLLVGISHHEFGVTCGVALIGLGAAGLGPSLLVIMGAIVPRERRGTGAGILQLCGDAGGMLGPLVGTTLFAGDVAMPYFGTALLVACFVPIALWLVKAEQRAGI